MTSYYAARRIVRATIGDEFYGPSCPKCASPKGVQALECRACYRDRMRDAAYWARRSCRSCGAANRPRSVLCRPCQHERQRRVAA